jgi:tripartite-type tricarboxylate transporter receptor subunit TctC
MMRRSFSMKRRAFLAMASVSLAAPALAQTYPDRLITVVTPFAAGSGTDVITRILTRQLSAAMGQTVIVDNKPGANGLIAAAQVMRAPPDGYTLFATGNTTHSANPSLLKDLPYDPVKDFTAVARTGNFSFVLVVPPSLPAKTVGELVGYARKNPGKLSYASANSPGIVAGAIFAKRAGLDLLHVPYKSSPQALTDVMAGRVSMSFIDFATASPHIKSGALRALAVTSTERSALLPDLPTMQEAGISPFNVTSWSGYFGPANMPAAVVQRLNTEIRKIVAMPDIKAQLATLGFDAFSGPPIELADFVQAEILNWHGMVQDSGIEPQ